MTRRTKYILGTIVVVLIAFRVALPSIVLHYVNQTLASLDGYKGSVDDIDIHLWRGAYQVEGLRIVKVDGRVPVPFFEAKTIDLAIYWRQLLHMSLVGQVRVSDASVNFSDGKAKEDQQAGNGEKWTDVVRGLFPLRIDRFEVAGSTIKFHNYAARPPIHIELKNLHAVAKNLTNSTKISQTLVSTIDASAKVLDEGRVSAGLRFNPFSEKLFFDLDVKALDIDMVKLNDVFREYVKIDFSSGKLDVVMEAASKNNHVKGYIKPLLREIDIANWSDDIKRDKDGLGNFLKESGLGALEEVLQNQRKDQFATRIPFEGEFDDPKTNPWTVFKGVWQNAFKKPLKPNIENRISFESLPDPK